MSSEEKFQALFIETVTHWPAEVLIDLEWVEYGKKYMTPLVSDLADDLSDRAPHERQVFIRNMNHAIYVCIHKVAIYLDRIDPRELRIEAVKKIFDDNMKNLADGKISGWNDGDVKLVKIYFDPNVVTI